MKISRNTFYKISFHVLFLMFISCDETIQESCPEPKFGDLISIVDKGEMTIDYIEGCLLYTSPSPRDLSTSRMPSSA